MKSTKKWALICATVTLLLGLVTGNEAFAVPSAIIIVIILLFF